MNKPTNAPQSIFVPNLTLELNAAKFNHCSTICRHNDGILIAWYGGTKECHDDQSVYAIHITDKGTSKPLELGGKTGNPVLWNEGDKTFLLWSYFTDNGPVRRMADRWKYCRLWLSEITQDTELHLNPKASYIQVPHLLGRTNPIIHRGITYLPLYDEVNRNGLVLIGKNQEFSGESRLGEDMIQPTLWVEEDKICSLSRNFHSEHTTSRYSYSTDGITWTEPINSDLKNYNSSLHTLMWHGYPLVLWNDSDSIRRINLTLGVLVGGTKVKPLYLVNNYGSYPSMCEDKDGNLCISYTSYKGTILFHTWYRNELLDACRRGDSSGLGTGPAGAENNAEARTEDA